MRLVLGVVEIALELFREPELASDGQGQVFDQAFGKSDLAEGALLGDGQRGVARLRDPDKALALVEAGRGRRAVLAFPVRLDVLHCGAFGVAVESGLVEDVAVFVAAGGAAEAHGLLAG